MQWPNPEVLYFEDLSCWFSYADWYVPPEDWEQPTVHADTLVMDLLRLKSPQPNADAGSLCTVMSLVSPFSSLNWFKIPCDYPIFRAGLICKQRAYTGKWCQSVSHFCSQPANQPSFYVPIQPVSQSVIQLVRWSVSPSVGRLVIWLLGESVDQYVDQSASQPAGHPTSQTDNQSVS